MAKYKVLKKFRDIETKDIYEKDAEIELTVKRAEEVAENLKGRGDFLERIDVEDKEVEEVKEDKEDKKKEKAPKSKK